MPVISALRKLRQESQEFKSSLGHQVIRASLNHIPISKRKRRGRAWEEMGIGLSLHNFLHEDFQSLSRARKKLCDFELVTEFLWSPLIISTTGFPANRQNKRNSIQ